MLYSIYHVDLLTFSFVIINCFYIVVTENNNNSTDESESQSVENELPLKGRKGRAAPKAKGMTKHYFNFLSKLFIFLEHYLCFVIL